MLITEQKACKSVHWRIDVEFKFGSSLPAPGRRRHWSRRIGNRGCVMCGSGYFFFVWFFISWSVCENEIYNPDPSTKSRSSRNLLLQHIRFLLLFLVIWNEDFWVSSDKCRAGMLESFCTIYQRNSEIFFSFVLGKTLRNIRSAA